MADFRYAGQSEEQNAFMQEKAEAVSASAVDYSLPPSKLTNIENALIDRATSTGSSDPGDAQTTANYLLSGNSTDNRANFLSNALADEKVSTPGQFVNIADKARFPNAVSTIGNAGGNRDTGKARANPLDNYANYTYGLTMRVLSTSAYNGKDYNGKVLVASAGRRGSGAERSGLFNDDFYFDNFKMTGVIGLNSRSRSSNVITMQFTIVEPYGITFMDRLLAVAKELAADNWNEMPFVMQIDFYGNADNGAPVNPIPGQSKIIPFKLIECKIKASTRGSEYQCTAVPFNHQAFQESVASTPANFESRAETINDFFGNDDEPSSFTAALNKYNKKLTSEGKSKKAQEHADIYAFEIDDEIKGSKIVKDKKVSSNKTPMSDDNNKKSNTAQGAAAAKGGPPVAVEMNTQMISINAGTSIIDVINLVLRNSEYITKQMEPGKKAIDWFKIIPEIKLGKFDKIRKTYQKTITYKVIKYAYHNTKYPGAPISLPDKWSKEYNYMYTGLNQSIIDFSIDFDTMFYTAMTASKQKESELENVPGESETEKVEIKNETDQNGIAPRQIKIVTSQTDVASKEGNNDEKAVAAADFYKSLMTSSRGDMINIRLKIAGDPEFIKQDDFYITDAKGELANGSITTDTGEVFVYLKFRSPSDLVQETGLMDFTTYKDTVFSGLYRVITIENIFERGQFTQVLDLVRLFDQPGDSGVTGGAKPSQQRIIVPSGAAESAKALAIDEAGNMMKTSTAVPTPVYGKPNTKSLSGYITDNAVLVGGAMGEGDAGAIMDAARTGQAQREAANADNAAEIVRLTNRANAAKLKRATDSEPIPINILGPETFGP